MPVHHTPQATALGRSVAKIFDYAIHYGVEIALIILILYICISRGLTFSIDVYDPLEPVAGQAISEASFSTNWFAGVEQSARAVLASFASVEAGPQATPTPEVALLDTTVAIAANFPGFNEVALTADPAPHISNLTLVLSPDYAKRKNLPENIVQAKLERVQHYIKSYVAIAQREMTEHGIPASITLAQGLLESNAGDSKLAVNSHNHFGIKCRTKCLGCTCRNYGDDTRYDMFRVFTSAEDSFREHSKLLNTSRYAKLKKHGKNYQKWAHGLKACGYATDKNYGQKLIKIIEALDLDAYDRAW